MRRGLLGLAVVCLAGCGSSTAPTLSNDGGGGSKMDGGPGGGTDTGGGGGGGDTGGGGGGMDATSGGGNDAQGSMDAMHPADGGGGVGMDAMPGGNDARPGGGDGGGGGGPCASNADCVAPQVCGNITVVNNMIQTQCTNQNPAPPAAMIGGSCTMDMQCQDGLCMSGLSNECSLICGGVGDCPQGFSCTGFNYSPGPVTLYECSRMCTHNASCAGGNPGNLCILETFQRPMGTWHLDEVCLRPLGMGTLGSTCAAGGDCRAGLCVTSNGHMGCSELCNDNTDCAAANQPFMRCAHDVVIRLPNSATVAVSACAQ